jgi:hypothetical protein
LSFICKGSITGAALAVKRCRPTRTALTEEEISHVATRRAE